ncbi:MAG: ornithine cyclodeaminase family protein [Myxococcaceae bacterium]
MLTAVLTRADVSRHLQALHLLQALREAFGKRAAATGAISHGSGVTTRTARLEGIPAWSALVETRTAEATRAVLQLHDLATGKLLAVMDATHLLALRTSLMSALAADVLARTNASRVAVLGMGSAASSALKALRLVRSIDEVWLYEPNTAVNFELAKRLGQSLSMAIHAADSVAEATEHADLVVLTGSVALGDAPLRAGTHLTVLAAESFSGTPLAAATVGSAVVGGPVVGGAAQALARARRFTDSRDPVLPWFPAPDAELADVLAQTAEGRQHAEQVTLFTSVAPPWLDLLAAWHVFEGARLDETLTRIDLEA